MTLSIVIPVLNEEQNIEALVSRLRSVLDGSVPFEVILVNDGSTDSTPDILRKLNERDPRIKSLHLTRNFGHQTAISAGLQATTGDAVVVMDGDLQDDPDVIPEFLTKWRGGYEVVYAVRSRRDVPVAKWLAYKLFYRALRTIAQISIPLDSGDFSLMDRRVVDAVNAMPERTRFVRGMRSWVGFRQIGVLVPRLARNAGRPKYSFRRLLGLALDGLFSFSYRPLQIASLFGFAVSFLAVSLAVVLVFLKVLRGIPLSGWTSLIVTTLLLGGVQLISLGILGEYIGRIYDETRARPSFLIATVIGETRLSPPVETPRR